MRHVIPVAFGCFLAACPAVALAQSNTALGAGSGILAGALVGGPIGAVVGGVGGALIGSGTEPRRHYYRPYRARYFVDRYGRRRYYR